jgi:hypothetical protein
LCKRASMVGLLPNKQLPLPASQQSIPPSFICALHFTLWLSICQILLLLLLFLLFSCTVYTYLFNLRPKRSPLSNPNGSSVCVRCHKYCFGVTCTVLAIYCCME